MKHCQVPVSAWFLARSTSAPEDSGGRSGIIPRRMHWAPPAKAGGNRFITGWTTAVPSPHHVGRPPTTRRTPCCAPAHVDPLPRRRLASSKPKIIIPTLTAGLALSTERTQRRLQSARDRGGRRAGGRRRRCLPVSSFLHVHPRLLSASPFVDCHMCFSDFALNVSACKAAQQAHWNLTEADWSPMSPLQDTQRCRGGGAPHSHQRARLSGDLPAFLSHACVAVLGDVSSLLKSHEALQQLYALVPSGFTSMHASAYIGSAQHYWSAH